MIQRKRSVLGMVLFAALFVGAGLAAIHPTTARADDDGDEGGACTAKKFNYPAVEKACKDGGKDGRKAAKKLMKAALQKAKADGKDWKCKSCHKDMKNYDLTDNAIKDLKPYI